MIIKRAFNWYDLYFFNTVRIFFFIFLTSATGNMNFCSAITANNFAELLSIVIRVECGEEQSNLPADQLFR